MEKNEIAVGLRIEAAKLLKIAREYELKAAALYQSAAILDGREQQTNLTFLDAPPVARAPKGSRRAQVRSLLNLSGPMTRHEIMSQTGIPKGTLDHILNPKNGFEKLPGGIWKSLISPDQVEERVEDKLGIE